MEEPQNQNHGAFAWMARHPLVVIGVAVLITALLSVPFLTMAPTTSASQEPGGAVFEARDAVEDRFVSAVFDIPIIVESRDGNLLTRESLIELLENAAALRAEPQLGSTLLTYYDPTTGSDVVGVRTIADFVDARLPSGLEPASDAEVDAAVAAIIEEAGPESDALSLSADTRFDADTGRWIAPALLTAVLADNDMLRWRRDAR